MQFVISKSELERELNVISGIAGRRSNAIPVLNHIAIDAADNKLKISATDLNITLVTVCDAVVMESGSACIHAQKLLDVVRLAGDSDMKFDLLPNDWVKIKTESSTFKLPAIARDQFPETPVVVGVEQTISAKMLQRLISVTAFAVSKKEGNYALHNIKCDIADSKIKLTASDGQRFAMASATLSEQPGKLNTLIPDFTASQIVKLSENFDGDVIVKLSQNHLQLQFGKRVLISSLSTGEYPDCDLLVPPSFLHSLEFNRERLILAVRRAALMAQDKGKSIILDFQKSTISAANSEAGEAQEVLPTDSKAQLVIAFNYQFILDCLEVLNCEQVLFELNTPKSQAQIRPAEEKTNSTYKCIFMPMIIRDEEEKPEIVDQTQQPVGLSLD